MTSENIGEKDDLELNAEDADQVVGGNKKKKKAAAHKSPATRPGPGANSRRADEPGRHGAGYDQGPDRPQPRPCLRHDRHRSNAAN